MKFTVGKNDDVKIRCIGGVKRMDNDEPIAIELDVYEEIDEHQKITTVEEVEGKMIEIVPGARYRTNHYITHQYFIVKIKQRYIDEKMLTEVYLEEEPYVPPPELTMEQLEAEDESL